VAVFWAVVAAILTLLSKPGFWYCVVALLCAAMISKAVRQVAQQIFAFRVALRLASDRDNHDDYDDDDDSDDDLPIDHLPPLNQLIAEERVRQKDAKR
jgi:hypothetical protein